MLGIVGTAVAALIFAVCASCAAAVTSAGRAAEKEIAAAQKAHPASSGTAKLGEPFTFAGDSTWTVTAARDRGKRLAGAGDSASTAGRFVEVRFAITNLTKKEDSILDLPAIVDDQGREFKPFDRSSSFLPAGARDLAMAPLPPSLSKEFSEIYELPADAGGLKFKARTLVAFGDTKLVDLGLAK